jgi:uncharacterized membrane protein
MSKSKRKRQTRTPLANQPAVRGNPALVQTRASVQIQRVESFQGPLPLPSHLRDYDMIVPGLADRIAIRFEAQSEHRMSMEREALRITKNEARLGQILAAGTMVFFLGVATYALSIGAAGSAAWLGTLGIAPVAAAFIWGPKRNSDSK